MFDNLFCDSWYRHIFKKYNNNKIFSRHDRNLTGGGGSGGASLPRPGNQEMMMIMIKIEIKIMKNHEKFGEIYDDYGWQARSFHIRIE